MNATPQTDGNEADADTVASRAAQVIATMGADIRALTGERDRYRAAWRSARERAQAYGEGILRVVKDREQYQEWLRQADARTAPAVVSSPPATDRATADVLVAEARRAVHESLIHLAAPEADRVRALIADLETAVEASQAERSDVGTEFVRQADQPDEARLAAFETDLAEAQPEPGSVCWLCLGKGAVAVHIDATAQFGRPLWTAHKPTSHTHPVVPCPVCRGGKAQAEPEAGLCCGRTAGSICVHDVIPTAVGARQPDTETQDACTCASAGDAFVPAGHYRDCPQAARSDVGTEFVRQADQPDHEAMARVEAELEQSGVDTPGCDCGHDGMGVRWHDTACEWRSTPPCDHCGRRGHSFEDCPQAEEPAGGAGGVADETGEGDPIRISEELCPGFPDRCPNLRTVEPEPGVHLGGVRCGCADGSTQ